MAKSSPENRQTFRDIAKLGAALIESPAAPANTPAVTKTLRLGEDIDYEKELGRLQVELIKFQQWVRHKGARVVVIFEGRDAAGKGGTIKRITESLIRASAVLSRTDHPYRTRKTQWYFQRYVADLPAAGEIVLFDRSWQQRAGVERVMGLRTEAEYL